VPAFTVIPAIDLKDGRCVRLRQGRADDVTVYGDDPAAMARHWAGAGARFLHVVDLDGAFAGRVRHIAQIRAIVEAAGIPVEMGGGLRTDEAIEEVLAAGVSRAIVGTRAFAEPGELKRLVARFGERLAVGIDARNGFVQVRGWVETTGAKAVDLAAAAAAAGVSTVIYTDTATDGMLQGPNMAAVAEVCDAAACSVIASGGVAAAADVRNLVGLRRANLAGAIVGKALYDGRVSLPELLAAARSE
jgi:phosphoribosylformimino-5-aminoimidazole carboxamide ribotide isomerase